MFLTRRNDETKGTGLMPSQLTSKLHDGTATNLNDFALNCARDLSLFIELRDEPTEPALPLSFTPRSYYSELVEKIEAEIATVNTWDDKAAEAAAQAFYQERKQEYDTSVETTKLRRRRYEQMREEIEAWQPPTAKHVPLKDYMVRLLEQDMPFGCAVHLTIPQPMSGRQYKQVRLEELRSQLVSAVENRDGDIERNRIRTEWTTELRQSLPEDPRVIGD